MDCDAFTLSCRSNFAKNTWNEMIRLENNKMSICTVRHLPLTSRCSNGAVVVWSWRRWWSNAELIIQHVRTICTWDGSYINLSAM